MSAATEWFIYVQRKHDGRKACVAGPYANREAAEGKHDEAVRACETRVKDGAWLWFETWGVCEAPAGALKAALGVI